MTNLEAKQALARKLNISYADIANNDLFSDDDLQSYINFGVQRAWDFKPWPFTQKAKKLTTISDGVTSGYYDAPVDMMLDSNFRLTVNNKPYRIISMQAYQNALADCPTTTDRICAFWETYVFVNPNSYTVGDELDMYGKKYAPHLAADSDLLPFSPQTDNNEHSGNGAIVQLAFTEALSSDKNISTGTTRYLASNAALERKDAYDMLNILWKPFGEFFANQQNANTPMFNVPDFFSQRATLNRHKF